MILKSGHHPKVGFENQNNLCSLLVRNVSWVEASLNTFWLSSAKHLLLTLYYHFLPIGLKRAIRIRVVGVDDMNVPESGWHSYRYTTLIMPIV